MTIVTLARMLLDFWTYIPFSTYSSRAPVTHHVSHILVLKNADDAGIPALEATVSVTKVDSAASGNKTDLIFEELSPRVSSSGLTEAGPENSSHALWIACQPGSGESHRSSSKQSWVIPKRRTLSFQDLGKTKAT